MRYRPAVLAAASVAAAAALTAALLGPTRAPAQPGAAAVAAAVLPPAAPANPAPPANAAPAAPAAPAEKILPFDFQFQPNFYYCGPASTRMALTSHGVAMGQDEIARRLGTTTSGTNSAAETTRVLNGVLGQEVYQTRWLPGQRATAEEATRLQQDVVRAVAGNRAIVANIVGAAVDTAGVQHDFPGGHFVTIVGYRDGGRSVQVADPSGLFGPRTYWMATGAMADWLAARGYSA
jgi:hypothetical protein